MLDFLFTKTPLLFFVQSFWRDEAYSYLLAKKSILEIISLSTKDFSPPLYHLLLHYWIKIFGSSEIAIRSLSLLFYWLTIYVIYNILIDILKINPPAGGKKSFLYLLLFIINPLFIYYAFEARMYSMFAFFAILSFYSYYLKRNRLYFISTILGLYTHYFMVFIILGHIIFYFIWEKKNRINLKLARTAIISLLLLIPWLILKFMNGNPLEQSFWIPKITIHSFFYFFSSIYFGFESNFNFFNQGAAYFSISVLLFIVSGFIHYKKNISNRSNVGIYLLLWSIGIPFSILLISLIKPIFLPRYLIFSTIGLLLLFVLILDRLDITKRCLLLTTVLLITLIYNQQQVIFRQKSNLKKIIREIKTMANKSDLLYVVDPLNFHVAQYYFDANRVYIYGKNYDELPAFIGKNLIPENKLTNTLPQYPIKAFILVNENSYEIQSSN